MSVSFMLISLFLLSCQSSLLLCFLFTFLPTFFFLLFSPPRSRSLPELLCRPASAALLSSQQVTVSGFHTCSHPPYPHLHHHLPSSFPSSLHLSISPFISHAVWLGTMLGASQHCRQMVHLLDVHQPPLPSLQLAF